MCSQQILAISIVVMLCGMCGAQEATDGNAADKELGRQITQLVQRLEDDRAAERDAAEKKLLELAGKSPVETDRFLALLPKESEDMPLALRERLAKIRQQTEKSAAQSSTAGTTITLSAKAMPLAEVFAEIEKQTGNKLVDNREEKEEPDAQKASATIDLKETAFWPAIDQILDQQSLGVYSYGGGDALSIVSTGSNGGKRFGSAQYSGPFRIEVTEVQAQRNLRQPNEQSLKFQLEVSWEPRLRPIVISQPVATLKAMTDKGTELMLERPEAVLDVEVPRGTQAAEIVLPFGLPRRDVSKVTSLRGKLLALVPGRQVKFQFDDIAKAAGKTQQIGGVQVTVDDVRKNNEIWEVHMRMKLDNAKGALQSHRDWVFQNASYLVGKDGKPIDNAGLETTRQTQTEVGVAYLFDLPDGLDGLSWVYESPASIIELPVEYELKDIALP